MWIQKPGEKYYISKGEYTISKARIGERTIYTLWHNKTALKYSNDLQELKDIENRITVAAERE